MRNVSWEIWPNITQVCLYDDLLFNYNFDFLQCEVTVRPVNYGICPDRPLCKFHVRINSLHARALAAPGFSGCIQSAPQFALLTKKRTVIVVCCKLK